MKIVQGTVPVHVLSDCTGTLIMFDFYRLSVHLL